MSKSEVCISNISREWVIIAIIELVALSSHSGTSHDNIAVIMQVQVHFVSGERTLEYRQLAIVVKGIASCVSSSLLALLGKHTK